MARATRDLSLNNEETSQPFGLAPTEWGANAMAKSQKVDWTLVDLKNFGVTVFGYQNEVGSNFKPFGQTKSEFATAGTSTMKAGGQVRVGAFGFGFAQSSIASTEDSEANFSAAQQEASVTLDLPHLLPGMQGSSDITANLLPTLWASASDKSTPNSSLGAAASDTISTSFGGTWNWKDGYATLGYWNYSSDSRANTDSAWSGHGFNANFGAVYSSLEVDVGLSYGQSGNAVASWQSGGTLYNSIVTVSYKPNKLPGVWASATAGNYDNNAIAYDGTASDLYAVSTNGEYYSVTAGLDLTTLFWSPENSEASALTGQRSSIKLLYRYSDNLFVDSTAGTTKDADNLVAMMIQRKF
jgi:hypothetical protein